MPDSPAAQNGLQLDATRDVLDGLQKTLATRQASDMDALASLGTVFQLRARIAWLRRVRRVIARSR